MIATLLSIGQNGQTAIMDEITSKFVDEKRVTKEKLRNLLEFERFGVRSAAGNGDRRLPTGGAIFSVSIALKIYYVALRRSVSRSGYSLGRPRLSVVRACK